MRFRLLSAFRPVRAAVAVVGLWAALGLTAWANVTLRVESVGATAVPITGTYAGTTTYNVSVAPGTAVTLVAPPVRTGGWVADHWEDGNGTVLSTNAAVSATVDAAMTLKIVYVSGATIYYVNNSSYAEANSVCTAAGNDSNDGLAPGRPKATVQSVIDTYDLTSASAVVYIDPGTYAQSFSNTSADAGARFVGAGSNRTTFNVPSGQTAFNANGYAVRLEEIAFAGANAAQGISNLSGGALIRCKVSRMTGDGLAYTGATLVQGCSFEYNGGNGITAGSDSGTLTGNDFKNNTGAAIVGTANAAMRMSGNTGTGNGTNAIVIGTGAYLTATGTFAAQPLPYRVRDNGNSAWLYINRNGSATFSAGARVEFETGTGIYVAGDRWNYWYATLTVNGTAAQPVVFTSAQGTPAAGDWRGIGADAGGYAAYVAVNWTYAVVEYAGGNGTGYGVASYNGAPVTLTNCTVQSISGSGLALGNGTLTATTTAVTNCTGAGLTGSGTVKLTGCTIQSCGSNGLQVDGLNGFAVNCLFTGNAGNGVYGDTSVFNLTNCQSTNNTGAAYLISGNTAYHVTGNTATGNATDAIVIGTGWYVSTSGTWSPQTLRFVVRNNGNSGWLQVCRNGSATIAPGVRLEFEPDTGLYVEGNRWNYWSGSVTANGTAAQPVILTSAQATPAAGDWRGVAVDCGGYPAYVAVTMAYTVIEYAGCTNSYGVAAYNAAPVSLTNCTVRNIAGSGILVGGGTLTLTTSTVTNCSGNGVTMSGGTTNMTGSTVQDCTLNGMSGSGTGNLNGSTFQRCGGNGLQLPSYGSAVNCLITNNGGNGAYGDTATFALTNCQATGNTGAAYYVSGNAALFASGNTGTGNGEDLFVVGTAWYVTSTGTVVPQPLPYHVRSNGNSGWLQVCRNGSMTVAAGVRLAFEADTGLYVEGDRWNYWSATLTVNGTAAQPAVFTSAQATPAPGAWRGIPVQAGGYAAYAGMTFSHAVIEYAGGGGTNYGVASYGAATTSLTDCVVRYITGNGIVPNGGTVNVTSCTVSNCSNAGLAGSGTANVTGSTFESCGVNGLQIGSLSGSAVNCIFTGNAANGVYGDSASFTLTNNAATNNTGAAYLISGNAAFRVSGNTATGNGTDAIVIGTGWYVTAAGTWSPQTLRFLIRNNGNSGWLQVCRNGSATVAAGVRLEFETDTGLYVEGDRWNYWSATLTVNGTAAQPVVFTSAQATPAPGAWRGIPVQAGGYAAYAGMTFANAVIEYAGGSGYGVASYGAATASLTDCTIRNIAGLGVYPSSATVNLTTSTVTNCTGAGLAGSGTANLTGSTFQSCGSDGLQIGSLSGSAVNCLFAGNAANGVYGDSASFTLTNNSATNNTGAAYLISGNAAYRVSGNSATGNATDAIVIGTGWYVTATGTWSPQTLRCVVRNNGNSGWLYVCRNGAATFAAGARFEFETDTGLYAWGDRWNYWSGSVTANGTAAQPVVLTSAQATPAPGNWRGIGVDAGWYPAYAAMSLAYVVVEYAGSSSTAGIGVYNGATAALTNCIVKRCSGDGFYNNGASTFANGLLVNNGGRGVCHVGSSGDYRHVVLYGNGSGFVWTGGTPTVRNSIIWGNTTDVTGVPVGQVFSYCDIAVAAHAGTNGNISFDPCFVNAAAGDFHLGDYSPCIDAANGAYAPATDLAGNSRQDNATMPNVGSGPPWADIGAYEYQGDSPLPTTFYVNDGATGETGSLCTAVGNDAFHGFLPQFPMRTIQTLLDRYPDIGAGATLWIDPGTYTGSVTVGPSHAGLKIKGAGADKSIVDAAQANTALILNSFGAGEVSGLTLQNGKATGATALEKSGGGIRLNGASTALIANCILRNNAAGSGSGGGGLYTYNASPTIRNCLVFGNTGTGCGGIRTYAGAVTITNCTVANNTGGGIHKTGTGTLAVTNSISWANGDDLIGCTATYSCIEDGDTGTGNTALDPVFVNAAGGDYHLAGGSSCIDGADLATAPATDMEGTARRDDAALPPNGKAYPDMGAYERKTNTQSSIVYVNDGVWTESGSACSAPGNDANNGLSPRVPMRTIQAALNKYPAFGTGKTIWVDPGTYVENVTVTAHSGLRIRGATMSSVIVDGGLAGACFVLDGMGTGELSYMTLRNGKAVDSAWPLGHGGAVRCLNGTGALLERLAITSNTAAYGGALYSHNSNPTLRNCVLWGNESTARQGVVATAGNRNPSIVNCTIADNKSGSGGISAESPCVPAITNVILWGNGDELINCAATYSCIEDGDAGTGNVGGDPRFMNSVGGDYRIGSGSAAIDAGNTAAAPATDIAGSARHDDPGLPPDGSAYADMGAYEYQGTTVPQTLYVNDDAVAGDRFCTAAGNDANNGWTPATPMRHIQALLNKYPNIGPRTVRIDTGTYAENVIVTGANAGWKLQGAGAAYTVIDGGQLNTVIALTAFGSGEISGMTLQNGKATGATTLLKSGGGIRCYSGSNALIADCIIKNCSAGANCGGGGIYSYASSPTVRNCVIARCTGTGNGGLRTYNGAVTVMNCTVANNTGGGIHRTGTGTLTITNSIVWENGDDLNACTATYSCIQDGDAGTGNISANPFFINPTGGDYHLDPASPCINTGTATGAPATDLDGVARDATPDMGAYEYES